MTNDRRGHLDENDFIDLLDGAGSPGAREHVVSCAACGQRLEAITAALAEAEAVDVPEPPPAFWNDLSEGIRREVETIGPARPGASRVLAMPAVRWLAAAAMVVFAVALGVWRSASTPPAAPSPSAGDTPVAAATPGAAPADDVFGVPHEDAEWGFVLAAAEDLAVEDLHDAGVAFRPGTSDGIAAGLSDAERQELAALIKEALEADATESSS